jgi:hypothetical protein
MLGSTSHAWKYPEGWSSSTRRQVEPNAVSLSGYEGDPSDAFVSSVETLTDAAHFLRQTVALLMGVQSRVLLSLASRWYLEKSRLMHPYVQ